MEIQYRNTLDHLMALQKYVLRNSLMGKKMMLHRFMVVETIVIFITIIFAINGNPWKVFLGFAIATGLAWLFRERAVMLQFKKDFKRERRKDESGSFEKDRILRIALEGISVRIDGETVHYQWDEVDTAGRDRKHLYIVLTGVLHYVIPISAFSEEKEADNFLRKIASYRTSA